MDYVRSNCKATADCFNDKNLDCLERIERMTILRNRALELVRKSSDFEPDYLLVVDADLDFRVNKLPGIIRKAPLDWVVLSANGQYYFDLKFVKLPVFYYDLFAYVPDGSEIYMLSENKMLNNRPKLHAKLRRRRFVKCRSSFGGMEPMGSCYICRDMKVLYAPLTLAEYRFVLFRRLFQIYVRKQARKELKKRMKESNG